MKKLQDIQNPRQSVQEMKEEFEQSMKKYRKKFFGKHGLKGSSGIGVCGLLHVNAPYDSNGKVFVEWEYRYKFPDGKIDKYDGWKRMSLERALKEKRKIIKCFRCNKPAVRLEHSYPYMVELNACEDHLDTSDLGDFIKKEEEKAEREWEKNTVRQFDL